MVGAGRLDGGMLSVFESERVIMLGVHGFVRLRMEEKNISDIQAPCVSFS